MWIKSQAHEKKKVKEKWDSRKLSPLRDLQYHQSVFCCPLFIFQNMIWKLEPDWRCGSSGGEPASQVQNPKSKLQHLQKKKNKKMYYASFDCCCTVVNPLLLCGCWLILSHIWPTLDISSSLTDVWWLQEALGRKWVFAFQNHLDSLTHRAPYSIFKAKSNVFQFPLLFWRLCLHIAFSSLVVKSVSEMYKGPP
jgi:hypothetical protein